MTPGTIPANVQSDLQNVATALQTLATDGTNTATAQTAANEATAALSAAQTQQENDQTAVQTAVATLQTDLQAWVSTGTAPPALKTVLAQHSRPKSPGFRAEDVKGFVDEVRKAIGQ